jgi:cysteinyl-tRNA synthetase
MAVRFFMLQSHYRSTLDLTDDALQAAEKGYKRLMEALKVLNSLEANGNEGELDKEINALIDTAFSDMSDDFNTPKAMASLFDLASKIYSFQAGHISLGEICSATLSRLKSTFHSFIFDIFGLQDESQAGGDHETINGLMDLVIKIRSTARTNKDWTTSDQIRDALQVAGIQVKDGKEGASWTKI